MIINGIPVGKAACGQLSTTKRCSCLPQLAVDNSSDDKPSAGASRKQWGRSASKGRAPTANHRAFAGALNLPSFHWNWTSITTTKLGIKFFFSLLFYAHVCVYFHVLVHLFFSLYSFKHFHGEWMRIELVVDYRRIIACRICNFFLVNLFFSSFFIWGFIETLELLLFSNGVPAVNFGWKLSAPLNYHVLCWLCLTCWKRY